MHAVLPGLDLPVRPTRQQVCYFTDLPNPRCSPSGGSRYFWSEEPVWLPATGAGLVKVGLHAFGETANPDAGYEPDMQEVEAVRGFLRRVIPDAAEATLAGVDRCMYDVSPDEDFILDAHPAAAASSSELAFLATASSSAS